MRAFVALGLLAMSGMAFAQDPDPDYDLTSSNFDYTGANTAAGEEVENVATVTYEVGGVEQETEANDPNEAKFVVDRVILLNVSNTDASNEVSVAPLEEGAYLTYEVRNDSNATIDIKLDITDQTGDFSVIGLKVYRETGGTAGVYDEGVDTEITGTMHLEDVAEGDVVTIYVVGEIPDAATVSNDDEASIALLATAYETDGTTLITEATAGITNEDPSALPGDPLATGAMRIDTVFGDLGGTYNVGPDPEDKDLVEDGRHSDTGTFVVGATTITVAKASSVIRDPFNETTNPKAIPGAEVLYCITVSNTGAAPASNVSVRDPIPDYTTYVPGSIKVFTAAVASCDAAGTAGGTTITDLATDDAAESTANSGISGNSGNTLATPTPEVAGEVVNTTVSSLAATTGVTVTVFRVTID